MLTSVTMWACSSRQGSVDPDVRTVLTTPNKAMRDAAITAHLARMEDRLDTRWERRGAAPSRIPCGPRDVGEAASYLEVVRPIDASRSSIGKRRGRGWLRQRRGLVFGPTDRLIATSPLGAAVIAGAAMPEAALIHLGLIAVLLR